MDTSAHTAASRGLASIQLVDDGRCPPERASRLPSDDPLPLGFLGSQYGVTEIVWPSGINIPVNSTSDHHYYSHETLNESSLEFLSGRLWGPHAYASLFGRVIPLGLWE